MQTTQNRVLAFPAIAVTTAASTPSPTALDLATHHPEALLGPGDAITRVRAQIARVAPYFRAAVVCGEPGTGAEAVARSLHAQSPARDRPFRVLDAEAAALFASLAGNATTADQGTLFLPQIEQLSSEAQYWFLRRIRQRSRPVRVIAGVQTDLRALVSTGRFSLDLADALGAIRISLAPLRERREDISMLLFTVAQRLAAEAGNAVPVLDASFLAAAAEYAWPGNLGEVDSVMRTLIASGKEGPATAEDLEAALAFDSTAKGAVQSPKTRMLPLEDIVQEHIRGVLVACHGNKLRAAEVLGISRSTLYRMLDSYAPERLSLAS